ncbi:MAG: hypothetical protein ACYC3S_03265 [Chloroflexota bacterium]
MPLLAFAFPIVPGKRARWDTVIGELNSTRFQDFVNSRRRLGLRERTFLQETPMGDLVILTEEGEDPKRVLTWLTSDDPFARWMGSELGPIHGFDLNQPMPADVISEVVVDSGNEVAGKELLAFALPILPGKSEQFRNFTAELNGARRAEFVASRERLGLRQRVFHQSTPMADMTIVTLVGADPTAIRQWFAAGDALSQWVARNVMEIQGVDMTQPLPASANARLVIDSERSALSRAA